MPENAKLVSLLRKLLAQTREISIILMDQDGLIIGWSGAAQIAFGHDAQEVMGQWFGCLFTKADVDQRIPEHELSVAASGTSAEDDRWLVRKDGGRFWVSGVTTALRSETGQLVGYAKVVRDRTDLKAQVEHNAKRMQALVLDNRRLANLVAELADQLQGHMSTLTTALDSMNGLVASVAPLVTPLQVARHCATDLQTLLEHSLGAARPSTQAWEMALFPVELGALLSDFAEGVRDSFAQRGIAIRLVIPKAVIVHHVNPVKINRLLGNLAANALQHTPSGGTVWLTLTVESSSLAIRIKDTGSGIAPQVLPTLFELFSDEHQHPLNGREKGLSTAKRIADEHGGAIEVRSPGPGHGSEFTLRLSR